MYGGGVEKFSSHELVDLLELFVMEMYAKWCNDSPHRCFLWPVKKKLTRMVKPSTGAFSIHRKNIDK